MMAALCIIELGVVSYPLAEGCWRFIGPQVDILILHTAPQLFDNDIVDLPPFAVHTDVAVMREKYLLKASLIYCAPWSVLKISGIS